MKIAYKLQGGFLVVVLISVLIGGISWYGLDNSEQGLERVVHESVPSVALLGDAKESMNGIKSAERTLIISGLTREDRLHELDNFEKRWATFDTSIKQYDALPKTPEEKKLWKEFLPAEKKWKEEHDKLKEKVSGVRLEDPQQVEAILTARQLDHIKWVAELDKSIASGSKFNGQLDPTQCGLGKWLDSFKSGDAEFDSLLAGFRTPHEHLHLLGGEINTLISKGETGKAETLFIKDVRPTLGAIEAQFAENRQFARDDTARLYTAKNLAFGPERAAFGTAFGLLDKLVQTNRTHAFAFGDETVNLAQTTKTLMMSAIVIGAFMALTFGFLLSKSITNPVNQAIRVITKIGQGDTSEKMSPGKLVNCSQIKKCNEPECPSFGKVDACWVTSGSFAVVKHCPRAKRGEDCRSCNLYGAKTEMEELGAILAGLENFLNDREEIVSKMASGDLTKDVVVASARDRFGTAFKKMVENLREIISQTQAASSNIASGAVQVSGSSQSLSQGASEQAASLEEISSSMNEMASQTSTNAENANQAKQLSQTAKNAAEKGAVQMREMVKAMDEINSSSQDISKIIKVIDEIAFQTNLLALNAAVEAARAGKYGRGFAVVAEEVRNLAARSAKAAKETAELIEGTVGKTKNGAEIAKQTSASLQDIVAGITSTSELVDRIAGASNEQAQGFSQVNQGIGQIDLVTQQNTANAEESAAAAEELSAQSQQLSGMLSSFRLKGQSSSRYDGDSEDNFQQKLPLSPKKHNGESEESKKQHFRDVPSELISLDDREFGKYGQKSA